MIDWRSKLTSRKFWAAIAQFASMLIIALHGTQETATQVTALIMAGAAVIAYIIGEGLADAAGAANANGTTIDDGKIERVERVTNMLKQLYEDDDEKYDADDPPDKWGESGLFHGTSGDEDDGK